MSEYKYKPTTWIGGKTIGTADVMNNIEDGIVKAHERLDNLGDISSGGGSGSVDLSDYATKEELTTLENTLNEHLENHPSGSGEIANDYGVLSDYGDFGIIKNLPSEVESTIPFVAYIQIYRGYGVFTQDFTISDNHGIKLINYYYKENINDWDFKNSQYFVNSNAYDGESAYKEIITNSEDVYNQLVAIGISEDIIICTQNTFSKVQQLRGTTEKISEYKGEQGQIVVNTDDNTIHVMDGETLGGTKLVNEEMMSNAINNVNGGNEKEWETIIDFTIIEDTSSAILSQDINGNPFCLGEFEIFVFSTPNNSSSDYQIDMNIGDKRNTPVKVGICPKTGSKKYIHYSYFVNAGSGYFPIQLCSVNSTSSYTMLANSNTIRLTADENNALLNTWGTTCESIWIGSHYQPCLTAGTRIIVRGVKK